LVSAVDRAFEQQRRALRGLDSRLAWHPPTHRWAFRHLTRPTAADRYRTLPQLPWDLRNTEERVADEWWDEVPSLLDDIVARHGWISAAEAGARTAARFWLLLRQCDRANEWRCELLERHRHRCRRTADAYPFAIVVDRSAAIAEQVQVYGTLACSNADLSIPVVEPAKLDARRETLGLRSHDDDVRRGVDELAVVRWLSSRGDSLSI
jgi:hypothetical protein